MNVDETNGNTKACLQKLASDRGDLAYGALLALEEDALSLDIRKDMDIIPVPYQTEFIYPSFSFRLSEEVVNRIVKDIETISSNGMADAIRAKYCGKIDCKLQD